MKPDMLTLAKSLAGGVPIGALLTKERDCRRFQTRPRLNFRGKSIGHGSGSGSALSALLEEGMLENCTEVGAYFPSRLEELKRKFPFVGAVRGKGLILGMELKIEDGRPIVIEMMKRGFLINCTMGNVLRFLPPLIVTKKEIDQMLKALRRSV